MEGGSLPWRDWNPKINLLVLPNGRPSCPTLKFSLPGRSAFYRCSCLHEKICMAPSSRWGRLPARPVALDFTLLFFLCASWVEKHSKWTGVLLISCKGSWEEKLVMALHAHSWAGLCSELKSIEISVPAKPDLLLILQHKVLPASVLAAFTEGGWLYRLITVCSLVMKQLPDVRHECSMLTHWQVCHVQDNHVQEIQESGFIFKLIFV